MQTKRKIVGGLSAVGLLLGLFGVPGTAEAGQLSQPAVSGIDVTAGDSIANGGSGSICAKKPWKPACGGAGKQKTKVNKRKTIPVKVNKASSSVKLVCQKKPWKPNCRSSSEPVKKQPKQKQSKQPKKKNCKTVSRCKPVYNPCVKKPVCKPCKPTPTTTTTTTTTTLPPTTTTTTTTLPPTTTTTTTTTTLPPTTTTTSTTTTVPETTTTVDT